MVCGLQITASSQFEEILSGVRTQLGWDHAICGSYEEPRPRQLSTVNRQRRATNSLGERLPDVLTQRLTVDATGGFLGRYLHDLTELSL
jgi:hypothetical protein